MSTSYKDIQDEIANFKDITFQLNNYNEIYSLNDHLEKVSKQEDDYLERKNNALRSKVLKLKQEYLSNEREISFYSLKINIMHFTVIIFGLIFILVGFVLKNSIPYKLALVIAILLGIFYIFAIFIMVIANRDRRNLFWNQFYWDNMQVS